MKKSILLINLEFLTWRRAKNLSYCAQLGLEEGLAANHVDYFTLPSLWTSRAKDILAGKKFDQIWIELIHTDLSDDFYQWLSTLAPVRVGFTLESINYSPEEYQRYSFLKGRQDLVKKRMKFMTHMVTCDERDAENLHQSIPALWWPQAIPKKFIEPPHDQSGKPAIFCGALYSERKAWFKRPEIKTILKKQTSSENQTVYPMHFNALNIFHLPLIKTNLPISSKTFEEYMHSVRSIRRECFKLWLESMRKGSAVVNLPHRVKTYAGRVVEAMAAGVPVISWEVPDRPLNKALFKDGEDILLFSKDKPEQLVEKINKIIQTPGLGQTIAQNAQKKILKHHTVEKRVEQILKWIERGENPQYYD